MDYSSDGLIVLTLLALFVAGVLSGICFGSVYERVEWLIGSGAFLSIGFGLGALVYFELLAV